MLLYVDIVEMDSEGGFAVPGQSGPDQSNEWKEMKRK